MKFVGILQFWDGSWVGSQTLVQQPQDISMHVVRAPSSGTNGLQLPQEGHTPTEGNPIHGDHILTPEPTLEYPVRPVPPLELFLHRHLKSW